MSILVIAEHDNQALKVATLNTISAAMVCGIDVHVLVAGYNAGPVAASASQIVGVKKVLHADDAALTHGLSEVVADLVIGLAGQYSHLLFAASSLGKSVAPMVAALLDVGQISEISKVVGPDTFERPIYAGNAVMTLKTEDPIKVLTVRTTSFPAAEGVGGSAVVESVSSNAKPSRSRFVGNQIARNERPELTAATVVISGGRALGSASKFSEVLTPLADRLGAALGASRAAVDAGYAPNDWQVGQTGKIVAPRLYMACGISGAIQHLAGMKDSQVIVAINKDAEAPIFSIADYGVVADLFEAVPELVAELG